MELDVFARGWVNTWGHHFDRFGQSFVTDGAGGQGINYAIPGAAYQTAQGVPRLFPGLNPGSPKYCGLEMVSGSHLPDDWQGNLLTNDFRGHRVCRFVLSEDGAGFAAREQVELIKTSHVAFRPIDIKMGPDGAIYIADWYNPIIQHGEVDFRDPRRDHVHGRIWRVTYKGRPLVKRPNIVDATEAELLEHLKAPEDWTRERARLELKSRGADAVLPELKKWLAAIEPGDAAGDQLRLEGLWVSQSVRSVDPQLLESVLTAADARVRAAGIRVVQEWTPALPNHLELLARGVADEHPRVRMEAVRVLGNLPNPESVALAMQALDSSVDRFLDYALWLTAWELAPHWVPRLQDGDNIFEGNPRHLAFAAQAAGAAGIAKTLVALMTRDGISPTERVEFAKTIAPIGDPGQLRLVLETAVKHAPTAQSRTDLLTALTDSARRRKVSPGNGNAVLSALRELLGVDAEGVVEVDDVSNLTAHEINAMSEAARLVGLWKIAAMADVLAAVALGEDVPPGLRSGAVAGLTSLGPNGGHKWLNALAKSDSPAVRFEAAAGLVQSGAPGAAASAAELLQSATAGQHPGPVVAAFLQRKDGAGQLAAAIRGTKLNEDVAKLAVRVVQSSGRQFPGLVKALTTAGGITTGVKKLSETEMADLVTAVQSSGNIEAGEAVYRRHKLACMKCHAIGGSGGRVGPDLVSIGGSAQIDYLINSLLDPNDKVKEGYQTLVVVTDEGKTYSGIKVRQTDNDLILRDAEDRETAIPLDTIDQQVNGASLMPAGLTEQLTRQELIDLVRFLSALGKVDGLRVGREPVVRKWEALESTPEAAFVLRRTRLSSVAEDNAAWQWRPVYSRVNGQLPLHDLPRLPMRVPFQRNPAQFTVVRFEVVVEAQSEGSIQLKFNSVAGLKVWIDGRPVDLESTPLNLSNGKHVATIAVDTQARGLSPLGVTIDGSTVPDVAEPTSD